MKAFKRKIVAMTILAGIGAMATGFGLYASGSSVKAEEVSGPIYVNIEDIVNEGKDIYAVSGYSALGVLYNGNANTTAKLNQVNQSSSNTDLEYAIYDRASQATDTHDFTYYAKGTVATSVTGVNVNANAYDGNYSYWMNNSTGAVGANGGMYIPNATDKNTILSFKTNWTGDYIWLVARRCSAAGAQYINDGSYYNFMLNFSTSWFINAKYKNSTGVGTLSPSNAVKEFNSANGTSYTSFNQILSKGDIVNISYGVYDTADKSVMYIKIYNDTKGWLVTEKSFETTLDTTDYSVNGSKMYIATKMNDGWKNDIVYDRSPNTIAGVTEPLICDGYDYTVEGTYQEGDAISSVTLPTGYAWKDSSATLTEGVNEIEATYTYDYYNGTYTKDCKVTVTVTEAPKYTISVKDSTGLEVFNDAVKQGAQYTFVTAENRDKKFIGYVYDGELYNVGDTVTPTENVEVTLLETSLTLQEKVSVRMSDNENGYGGIRFKAEIPAVEWNAIKASVRLYSLLIPTDLIVGELEYNETDAAIKELTQSDLVMVNDAYCGAFSLTDIRHYNYNRTYTGMAYLAVTYADGDVAYVKTEARNASVYELAVQAYAAHIQQKALDSVGLYSSSNVDMLERYINGVLDVKYTVNSGTATVEIAKDENGLLLEKGYALNAQSETSFEETDGKYVVTLKIDVNEDSALAFLASEGNINVPVIIRSAANYETYEAVKVLSRAYDNGVLTISFEILA
ncbi:MAG: hypothetical protein IJX91_03245 [Clostridia bacterium]|nr:hypothetical protein [Clostridia bacterium]